MLPGHVTSVFPVQFLLSTMAFESLLFITMCHLLDLGYLYLLDSSVSSTQVIFISVEDSHFQAPMLKNTCII